MSAKRVAAVTGAACAVAAGVFGAAWHGSAPGDGPGAAQGPPDGVPAARLIDQLAARPCDVKAVPDLAGASLRARRDAAVFKAAQPDPAGPALTADGAAELARGYSSDEVAASSATEEVLRTSLRDVDRLYGDGSSISGAMVAPTRCVWVVTVEAPYVPRSVPYGKAVHTFDRYSVVFDVASGERLDIAAGAGAIDLGGG